MLWNHFRPLRGLAAALVLVVGLTSCSDSSTPGSTQSPVASVNAPGAATPSPGETPTTAKPTIAVSTNLDGISVAAGELQKLPAVTIPAPWAVDKSQSKVLIPGSGGEITQDSLVKVHYWGGNARTGKVFQESFSAGKPVVFPMQGLIKGFVTGLVGQKAGSRVLIGITGPDGYGAQGGNPQAGIEADDCLVFVVDIIDVSRAEPSGEQVTPPAGLPRVEGELNRPVVTVAKDTPAPTSLVVQPLIKGTGAPVAAGDSVRVNFVEYAWSTGKMVRTTYGDQDKGYKPQDGALAETLPAWQQALVNQPVGSRVLIIAPPAVGYPSGDPRKKINPGETTVYVVDILFAYQNPS